MPTTIAETNCTGTRTAVRTSHSANTPNRTVPSNREASSAGVSRVPVSLPSAASIDVCVMGSPQRSWGRGRPRRRPSTLRVCYGRRGWNRARRVATGPGGRISRPGPCWSSADRLRLEERLRVVLDHLDGDVLRVDVTRLGVDLQLLADHGLARGHRDALGEDRVVDALAGAVGGLDRLEDGLHRRHAVKGVVRGRSLAVLLLVGVDELGARPAGGEQLVDRQAGEREVHALRLRRLVEVGEAGEPVRRDDLHLVVVAEDGDLVLDELGAARVVDAAHEDAVRTGLLDLLEQRRVVRGLLVPGVVRHDLDAVLGGVLLEHLRDALAVGLVVVQHVALLHAEGLTGEDRGRRTLDVVGGHDPGVIALARRVVLVGL